MVVFDVMKEVGETLLERRPGGGYKSKQGWMWQLVKGTRGSFLKRLAFHLNRKSYKEWDNAEMALSFGPGMEFWPLVTEADRYEAAYNMLEDEESRDVFLWRLKVRMTMPFTAKWESLYPAPEPPGVGDLSIGAEEEAFCSDFKTGQYLLQDICMPQPGDVVLDLGAYLGDSAVIFSRLVGDKGHVYSFEALANQFETMQKNMERFRCDNVTPCFNAAWNTNEQLLMCENRASSCIGEGSVPVQAVRIDDFVKERAIERVDFIKMDIEGAEQEALEGCVETIGKHRPKLALSAYHKPEDLYRLMEIVRDMQPDYRFYLRHYTPGFCDTVLYAV